MTFTHASTILCAGYKAEVRISGEIKEVPHKNAGRFHEVKVQSVELGDAGNYTLILGETADLVLGFWTKQVTPMDILKCEALRRQLEGA